MAAEALTSEGNPELLGIPDPINTTQLGVSWS